MTLLTLGAILSLTVAASHAGIAMTGAPAYRYFRAPDAYARDAEAGSWRPAVTTLMLAAMFSVWSLYALATAGTFAPLPLMEPVIQAITAIYLLRGAFLFPQLFGHRFFTANHEVMPRDLVFSVIVLAIGLIHLAGIQTR